MVGLTVASTVSLHNQYNLSQPILLMGDISPTARSGLYPDDLRSAARRSTAPDFNQASSLDPWLSTSSQVSARDLNEQQPRQSQQWRSRRHGSSALPLDDSTAIYGRIWWTHSTGSPPFRPFTFDSTWVPHRHKHGRQQLSERSQQRSMAQAQLRQLSLSIGSDPSASSQLMYDHCAPSHMTAHTLHSLRTITCACSYPELSWLRPRSETACCARDNMVSQSMCYNGLEPIAAITPQTQLFTRSLVSRICQIGYTMIGCCRQHANVVNMLPRDNASDPWVATMQVALSPASHSSCSMLQAHGPQQHSTTSQLWSMICARMHLQMVAQPLQCGKVSTASPAVPSPRAPTTAKTAADYLELHFQYGLDGHICGVMGGLGIHTVIGNRLGGHTQPRAPLACLRCTAPAQIAHSVTRPIQSQLLISTNRCGAQEGETDCEPLTFRTQQELQLTSEPATASQQLQQLVSQQQLTLRQLQRSNSQQLQQLALQHSRLHLAQQAASGTSTAVQQPAPMAVQQPASTSAQQLTYAAAAFQLTYTAAAFTSGYAALQSAHTSNALRQMQLDTQQPRHQALQQLGQLASIQMAVTSTSRSNLTVCSSQGGALASICFANQFEQHMPLSQQLMLPIRVNGKRSAAKHASVLAVRFASAPQELQQSAPASQQLGQSASALQLLSQLTAASQQQLPLRAPPVCASASIVAAPAKQLGHLLFMGQAAIYKPISHLLLSSHQHEAQGGEIECEPFTADTRQQLQRATEPAMTPEQLAQLTPAATERLSQPDIASQLSKTVPAPQQPMQLIVAPQHNTQAFISGSNSSSISACDKLQCQHCTVIVSAPQQLDQHQLAAPKSAPTAAQQLADTAAAPEQLQFVAQQLRRLALQLSALQQSMEFALQQHMQHTTGREHSLLSLVHKAVTTAYCNNSALFNCNQRKLSGGRINDIHSTLHTPAPKQSILLATKCEQPTSFPHEQHASFQCEQRASFQCGQHAPSQCGQPAAFQCEERAASNCGQLASSGSGQLTSSKCRQFTVSNPKQSAILKTAYRTHSSLRLNSTYTAAAPISAFAVQQPTPLASASTSALAAQQLAPLAATFFKYAFAAQQLAPPATPVSATMFGSTTAAVLRSPTVVTAFASDSVATSKTTALIPATSHGFAASSPAALREYVNGVAYHRATTSYAAFNTASLDNQYKAQGGETYGNQASSLCHINCEPPTACKQQLISHHQLMQLHMQLVQSYTCNQLVSDQQHTQLSPPQQLGQHASQQHCMQLASDQQLKQRTSPAYATASDQQLSHPASQQSMQPASQELLHLTSQQLSQFASASKQLTQCYVDTLSCSPQCSLQGGVFNAYYYHCSSSGGAAYNTTVILEEALSRPAILIAAHKSAPVASKFAGSARTGTQCCQVDFSRPNIDSCASNSSASMTQGGECGNYAHLPATYGPYSNHDNSISATLINHNARSTHAQFDQLAKLGRAIYRHEANAGDYLCW